MDVQKLSARPPGLVTRILAGIGRRSSENEAGAPPAPQRRPTLIPLTDEEIAAFWRGPTLRTYTRPYLEALAEKNGMELGDA